MKTSWNEIIGHETAKKYLEEVLEVRAVFVAQKEEEEQKGVMIYGASGTGKTLLLQGVRTLLESRNNEGQGVQVIWPDLNAMLLDFTNTTPSTLLTLLFMYARERPSAVLVLDPLDSWLETLQAQNELIQ